MDVPFPDPVPGPRLGKESGGSQVGASFCLHPASPGSKASLQPAMHHPPCGAQTPRPISRALYKPQTTLHARSLHVTTPRGKRVFSCVLEEETEGQRLTGTCLPQRGGGPRLSSTLSSSQTQLLGPPSNLGPQTWAIWKGDKCSCGEETTSGYKTQLTSWFMALQEKPPPPSSGPFLSFSDLRLSMFPDSCHSLIHSLTHPSTHPTHPSIHLLIYIRQFNPTTHESIHPPTHPSRPHS